MLNFLFLIKFYCILVVTCFAKVSGIVKGQDADFEKTFMGSIQRKEDQIHLCGGSFVSVRHMITACQCVIEGTLAESGFPERSADAYQVSARSAYNKKKEEGFGTIGVRRFGVHSKCELNREADIWMMDIGFVELIRGFAIQDGHFSPLKIPISQSQYEQDWAEVKDKRGIWYAEPKAWPMVIGWGSTDAKVDGGTMVPGGMSDTLQRRAVLLIPLDECKSEMCAQSDKYCKLDFNENTMFCGKPPLEQAGGLCFGDLGSPYLLDKKIWGIGSWTENCGKKFTINIFYKLDVNEFNKFIGSGRCNKTQAYVLLLCLLFLFVWY